MQMNVVKYAVFFGPSLCLLGVCFFVFCNLPALSCKNPQSLDVFGGFLPLSCNWRWEILITGRRVGSVDSL